MKETIKNNFYHLHCFALGQLMYNCLQMRQKFPYCLKIKLNKILIIYNTPWYVFAPSKLWDTVKGNVQFLFLWNPQKSGTSQVCTTFPQTTQKILTEDIIHCLKLFTEILSFLETFSVRKATTQLFEYLRKSIRKLTKLYHCKVLHLQVLDLTNSRYQVHWAGVNNFFYVLPCKDFYKLWINKY